MATSVLATALWLSSSVLEMSSGGALPRNHPKLGRCINVAGALEAPNEGDWGYRIRDEDLAAIGKAGFSVIRLPVKYSAHTEIAAPYTIDPLFMQRVDHVIDTAISNGLTVILDLHHYDELIADPEPHLDRFKNIWVQLSRHYKHYPNDKLIFELFNEPRDKFSGAIMSNAQNIVLSMIRQDNPTRTVILSGDDWGSANGLKNLYIPPDPNIMVSVHYYAPYKFTHQGASWVEEPIPTGAVWGNDHDITKLSAYAESLAKWQTAKNVPIFFGEFGVAQNVNVAQRANWTAGVRAAMEAADIPWCYFDFATGFYAFDQRRGTWNPLILNALVPESRAQRVSS